MSNENKSVDRAPETSAQAPVSREEAYAVGRSFRAEAQRQGLDTSHASLLQLYGMLHVERAASASRSYAVHGHGLPPCLCLKDDATEREAVTLTGTLILGVFGALPGGYRCEERGEVLRAWDDSWPSAQAFAAGWYGEPLPAEEGAAQ